MKKEVNLPGRKERPGCGCAGCLLALLGGTLVFAGLLAVGSIVLIHTTWPLNKVASLMEWMGKDRKVIVKGVSGSLSDDIGFRSIKWDRGEFVDVQVRHHGAHDLMKRRKLVLDDIHVGKTTLDLDPPVATGVVEEAARTNVLSLTPIGMASFSGGNSGFIQVDQVTLSQVVVTNSVKGCSQILPGSVTDKPRHLLPDILSRVLYEVPYAELTPAERADIDRRVSQF